MAQSQATDPQIHSLLSSPNTTLTAEAVCLANSAHPLYCDTSTGKQCPVVPLVWQRPVFNVLHQLFHPGIRATQKLVTSRYVWPGINSDIRRWTRACVQCQCAKFHRHTTALHSSLPTPDTRFEVIHIDHVGPLPPSQGFTYLLTCMTFSLIPLTSITANAMARVFFRRWISRFGVPTTIITDRGRQFESQLWTSFMILLGTKRSRTTAYHPQTNGMVVECSHRQLKAALKAQPNHDAWMLSSCRVFGLHSKRISL